MRNAEFGAEATGALRAVVVVLVGRLCVFISGCLIHGFQGGYVAYGDQCKMIGVGVAKKDLGFHAYHLLRILHRTNLTNFRQNAERLEWSRLAKSLKSFDVPRHHLRIALRSACNRQVGGPITGRQRGNHTREKHGITIGFGE